jgi:hypothetical protein
MCFSFALLGPDPIRIRIAVYYDLLLQAFKPAGYVPPTPPGRLAAQNTFKFSHALRYIYSSFTL